MPMKNLSLSQHLLVLSGVPLAALLVFVGLMADRTYETWRNAEQIVALGRLINAVEEYSHAIPAEAILSLGALETHSAQQKALIPAARARTDAAVADLARQAKAAELTDPMALANLHGAVAVDLAGNRARVDAGTETLADILTTWRPGTLQALELEGQLAVLSTDSEVTRLMLAYNVALWMNDAMLVERNVRPIAGSDGQLLALLGEAEGIAQQDMLMRQFERMAAPAALPAWRRFLADPASQEIGALRRGVLGIGGGQVDPAGLSRWTDATEQRLRAMAPVLEASSASLKKRVADIETTARDTLAGYAALAVATFGLALGLIRRTRRQLAKRIFQLSGTMRGLADGNLETDIPEGGPADELGEMTSAVASFKVALIERERLAIAQAAASAALLDEKERLRVTLHAIGDGMIVTDADERVTMMNVAAESLTGWTQSNALGSNIDDVLLLRIANAGSPSVPSSKETRAAGSIANATADATLTRLDGAELAVDASVARIFGQEGGLIGTITVLHDVTQSRMLLKRVRQLAHFDPLTGLPNRALFHDQLAQALLHAERTRERCALLFLDMNRFKHVNDTLGHAVGDVLLRDVAQRLSLAVRETDTVARLGGDEFVVIAALANSATAAQIAQKILDSVAGIESVDGHDIDVSFSIGIAIYPEDAADADGLLMRADAAMYQAKDSGRNAFAFFDPDMDKATQRRVQTRLRLAKALQLQQFALLYQPKVDLESGRITGAEALIRWRPEPGEQISPANFIPVAEESGLIVPIGNWVVNEACRQIHAWALQGFPRVPVSVNVSMKCLHNPNFVATLRGALAASGATPQDLQLEITESAAMADGAQTPAILSEIRALGILVSIDDFGTGYSSLSHLRRLPVDTIKIDRSFVQNMMEDEDDAALVGAIIGIAASMHKHVIAEGVETEAQRARLLRFGCREAQGFLFSRPVEPDVFAAMLAAERHEIVAASAEAGSRERPAASSCAPETAVDGRCRVNSAAVIA